VDFYTTFLFFFACPKNEPKKGKKSNASTRKAYTPPLDFWASQPGWRGLRNFVFSNKRSGL
jgi:hypothetical protein